MSLIELENATKNYRLGQTVVHALRGISLQIGSAEFAAVWGPSGSGKTTLLNLVGAIDEPSSGRVMFEGKDISQLSDDQRSELRNRSFGFIFQTFNLVPVLSALENVMLPLQIMGLSHKDATRKSLHRLEQVGLSDFVEHRPDKLSGGQQQRVSIARALVTGPSLVIADEPTANLDSDTALKIVQLMRDLNHEEKTTFIFSTHDERLLNRVDRLVRLVDGQLEDEV
jgi:putative ABC transport system ATP-binding protein